MTKQIEGISS